MSETKLYNGSDMFSVIGVSVGFERSQLLYIVHNQFKFTFRIVSTFAQSNILQSLKL